MWFDIRRVCSHSFMYSVAGIHCFCASTFQITKIYKAWYASILVNKALGGHAPVCRGSSLYTPDPPELGMQAVDGDGPKIFFSIRDTVLLSDVKEQVLRLACTSLIIIQQAYL